MLEVEAGRGAGLLEVEAERAVVEEQVRAWLEARGRSVGPAGFAAWMGRVTARVDEALGKVGARGGSGPREWLVARGLAVRVSDEPARFGSVLLRAATDLDRAEVVVYREGLEDLEEALGPFRARLPLGTSGLDMILAHELFHVLDPGCPADLAEAAAHLFCTRLLGLPFFASIVDRR